MTNQTVVSTKKRITRNTTAGLNLMLTAALGLALSGAAIAVSPGKDKRGGPLHELRQLDLSDSQKLEVKAILKQSKEDNSVFAGERQEIMLQMRDLMNMPTWDEETARQIILAQMEQGRAIALNRAQAKHAVYQVLSVEQKEQLEAKEPKNNRKSKSKKREGKMHKRLAKALALTDEQKTQWKQLHEQSKNAKQAFKSTMREMREQTKALIQSENFDEQAWQAIQEQYSQAIVEHRVQLTALKYQTKSILSLEQEEKFAEIKNKMKEKRRS